MRIVASIILYFFTLTVSAQQYAPADDSSDIHFTIKNFGLNTNGTLKGLKGTIQFNAQNLSESSFDVSVDVNTINTGIDDRDNHLKRDEYFNANLYPSLSFTSTKILNSNDSETYIITGNLTIKDVTKEITFPFKATQKNNGILFTGSFTIDRRDFHVGKNSMVLGDDVDVSLNVFAKKM